MRISGLRFIGKISREGVLYLDFSEHLEQYTNGVTPGVPGIYIHFANFPSLMHVRFGTGGIGSRDCASDGFVGGKRKSMTSHLSILISWMSSDGGAGVAVATTVSGT
jgi:hypothetical protein